MKAILRQGDVLLIPVAKIPSGATETKINGDVILAYGEVTGHAHRIAKPQEVRVWDAGAERYIQALNGAELTHEEHSAVLLEAGVIYRQIFQVEERGEEVKRVAD